jgi:hypothetical protein
MDEEASETADILLIVTPSLGVSQYLGETLNSIRICSGRVVHVVVHPEGVDFPEAFMSGGLSLYEPPQCKSLYEAINYAVSKVSNWSHLTYINDDDLLGIGFNSFLRNCLSYASESFCYGNVSLINDLSVKVSNVPVESDPSWFEALLASGISPLNQQGMIIPRSLWEKLGGFRAEYKLCADLDFWLRAHRIGWPFKYYPMEVGQFRIREGQLSGDTSRLEAEIAAVVARDAPRRISWGEKFYARWQFRIKNLPIYASRFLSGRRVRGMKMLAGK